MYSLPQQMSRYNVKMSTGQTSGQTLPTILSKLKTVKDILGSLDLQDESITHAYKKDMSKEEGDEDGTRRHLELSVDIQNSQHPLIASPHFVVAARKDSTFSTASSRSNFHGGNVNAMNGHIPLLVNLGGTSRAWGKRMKKMRNDQQKLARQKEVMTAFYRGTPVVDYKATPNEILLFLYKMWEPQLCTSYRKSMEITTNCQQDLRSVRKIAQTIPRHIAKLHRARVITNLCNHLNQSLRLETGQELSTRPTSAKSVI